MKSGISLTSDTIFSKVAQSSGASTLLWKRWPASSLGERRAQRLAIAHFEGISPMSGCSVTNRSNALKAPLPFAPSALHFPLQFAPEQGFLFDPGGRQSRSNSPLVSPWVDAGALAPCYASTSTRAPAPREFNEHRARRRNSYVHAKRLRGPVCAPGRATASSLKEPSKGILGRATPPARRHRACRTSRDGPR